MANKTTVKKKTTGTSTGTGKKKPFAYWIPVLLIIIIFSVYYKSLENKFTNWDDPSYVTENNTIKSINADNAYSWFFEFKNGHYHPLTWLSLAIDYSLYELKPSGYHFTNLLLHILNVLLVFLLFRKLGKNNPTSFWIALLFGLLPLGVESIAWVTERKNLLYVFFFLLSYLAYLAYKSNNIKKYYYWSVGLFILSCLSKSMAITLPIILFVTNYFQDHDFKLANSVRRLLPFFVISIITGILAVFAQQALNILPQDEPLASRLVYSGFAFLMYPVKIFVPFELSALYPYYSVSNSLWIYSGLIYSLSFLYLIYRAYRKNEKEIVFYLIFFAANLFFVLKAFNIPAGSYYMADRYAYLPSIGLFGLLFYLLNKIKPSYKKIFLTAVPLILSITFAYTTNKRIDAWKDSDTLWSDVLNKYSDSDVALINLGNAYRDKNKNHEAIDLYTRAISQDSTSFLPYFHRGYTEFILGDFKSSILDYNRSLELNPGYAQAYFNRSIIYTKLKSDSSALLDLQACIKVDPKFTPAYNSIGNLFFQHGMMDSAITYYDKVIEFDPEFSNGYYNRANVYARLKSHQQALENYDKAIELEPQNADYSFNRGTTKYYLNDTKGALEDINFAIGLRPKNPNYYINRSQLYMAIGEYQAAYDDLNKAIAIQPDDPTPYARRGIMLIQSGNKDGGCADLQKAYSLGATYLESMIQENCQ